MKRDKTSSKDVMLEHSRAKVEFYQTYLETYLSVMCNSPYVEEVHIWDLFCGRGVYDDGGLGSPILAVQKTCEVLKHFSKQRTRVVLHFNDFNRENVEKTKSYISQNIPEAENYCHIEYYSYDAEFLIRVVAAVVNTDFEKARHFIFVDPYGYKQIHKSDFLDILRNKRTEILLFLPVAFMVRFMKYANEDNCKAVHPLRQFFYEFFPEHHPVREGHNMNQFQFIEYLTEALSFGGKVYSNSYYIERSANSYFALFFMTHNLLGLEASVRTCWALDEQSGQGFQQKRNDGYVGSLFDEYDKAEAKRKSFEDLKLKLLGHLGEFPRTNLDIYKFILKQGYLPKHAKEVLYELEDNKIIKIELITIDKIRKGSYYLGYNHCKHKIPKIGIHLNNENRSNN